ncbi:30S ribosomal protein S4 [Patescibacteria group bacterium]|nr:30S ribosomal protein S4 [Patescibacteria group bacterium]MCG2702428.1 30S ribosomal protein S4 [Candidatus Parcubacteria bacterium]MBU4210332.1 30S ribosomal protein S4 [Patescibacteria group bacterium]MBU4264522.1 30S ribosomal protein S4 [Patescibacteria group bacterium]MBU4390453.1 30S ribosomal protein S4 [Patescibacteria group bacterium]
MARDTLHIKCKLCRREGTKLHLKGTRCLSAKCPIEKKGAVPPGMHGLKRSRRPSAYGIQLRAKQKLKRIYGILETQLKNYYKKAKRLKGILGDNLLVLLETRLDNIVYVSGLAHSRSHSRQIISHRHVLVNGKILNISSYSVKIGDKISIDKKTAKKKDIKPRAVEKDFKCPDWLSLDKTKLEVKFISKPTRDQISQDIDENLIIEYYSR